MFLFLTELYILGVLITKFFSGKLPDFFLAISSVLIGYLVYVLNGLLFVVAGISLTASTMILAVTFEIIFLITFQIIRKTFQIQGHCLKLYYLLVGLVHLGLAALFYFYNFFFVTTDSVFLVVMAQNLMESGLSQWYFSSPVSMGMFVPVLQTLGMLFNHDYTWFIQPNFMAIFLVIFGYFSLRSSRLFISNRRVLFLLVVLATGLLYSSDLMFVMTMYIHTNFNSGLFLFLIILTLYFAILENNPFWLFFTSLFMIAFGLMRVENVIFLLVIILIYVSSNKLSPKKLCVAFLPYLIFQFIWYLKLLLLDTNTYTDMMSDNQIAVTLLAVLLVIVLLVMIKHRIFNQSFFRFMRFALLLGLLAMIVGLGILNFNQLTNNIVVILQNAFLTGNWGTLWWIVIILLLILPFKIEIPQKKELILVITTFFMIVQVLGLLRVPYHDRWFDSANRMLAHIAPVIIFYLIMLIAKAGTKQEKPLQST